jgi:predicted small lipoprotein YifL
MLILKEGEFYMARIFFAARRRLRLTLVLALFALLLGCGNKGDLVKPSRPVADPEQTQHQS